MHAGRECLGSGAYDRSGGLSPPRRHAGFTVIELMTTVGVAAVLVGLALPSFTASIRSNRVSSAANTMLATVNFARMEAMRSKEAARICANNRGACGSDWSGGLLVWTDEDRNGALGADEVRRIVEPQNGIVLSVDAASGQIEFDRRGRRIGDADQRIEIRSEVCQKGLQNRRVIEIGIAGQASLSREDC